MICLDLMFFFIHKFEVSEMKLKVKVEALSFGLFFYQNVSFLLSLSSVNLITLIKCNQKSDCLKVVISIINTILLKALRDR